MTASWRSPHRLLLVALGGLTVFFLTVPSLLIVYVSMPLVRVRLKPSLELTPKVQLPLVGMVMMPVASVTKLSASTLMVRPGKVKSPPKFAPPPVLT